ncbi:MAG: cation transporter [Clostridia bacterium]|nr:cation transporter [Clostridia bacterium]
MPHNHAHVHSSDTNSRRNIGIAFFLNAAFVIIELVGGILTNSVAILSDAIHDLGDSLSLGLSWFLEKRSGKKGNFVYTYGYKRLSLIGALVNAMVLLVGSGFVIVRAVPRLFSPELPDARGMIVLAVLGIIINGAAVLQLRRGKKIAERVVSLHLLEDVLGWVAVLIISIVLVFVEIPVLDPVLSLLITAFVLKNIFQNFSQIIKIFLQAVPEGYNVEEIEREIAKRHPGVLNIHGTKLWTLDGENNIMTFHLCVRDNPDITETVEIKRSIKATLGEMGIQDVTIEIENPDNCSNKSVFSKDCGGT